MIHSLKPNLQYKGYGYIVEADIQGFFDNMNHQWLMKMLSQRTEDKAFPNLINQWLKASVCAPEDGIIKPASGIPQGGVISPNTGHIYLHYALDIWFEKRVKRSLKGRAMLIRYADDFVVAFQCRYEAQKFYRERPKRLKKFDLDVAPEKTHLKHLSRFHPRKARCFQFLGFEFYSWIKRNRSMRLNKFMPILKRKLAGFRNYFGLPDNSRRVGGVYNFVLHSLYKWLNKRSQRCSFNGQGFKDILKYFQIQSLRVTKRHIVVDWY